MCAIMSLPAFDIHRAACCCTAARSDRGHGFSASCADKKSDCVYQLGNRKVTLSAIANKLVVRLGGGYSDFLEFLEKARF